MLDFTQNLLDGVMFGASYALLGLGFTLIFGVMRRLNLSYGPTIMVGVYAGAAFSAKFYDSLLLALAITIVVSIVVGFCIERICFRYMRGASPLASMVSSFAMWMVLEEIIILLTWGHLYAVDNPVGLQGFRLGAYYLRTDYLLIFASALILMGLVYWCIYGTNFGRAVRGVAENAVAAKLMGVNVDRVSTQIFLLSSAFGGIVGFFIAVSQHQITPGFGLWATVKGLIVMILGGMGSIPGAIIGGLILGVVELQALWYLGTAYRDLIAYFLLFALLIVRPRGLFGVEQAYASGARL